MEREAAAGFRHPGRVAWVLDERSVLIVGHGVGGGVEAGVGAEAGVGGVGPRVGAEPQHAWQDMGAQRLTRVPGDGLRRDAGGGLGGQAVVPVRGVGPRRSCWSDVVGGVVVVRIWRRLAIIAGAGIGIA